MTKKQKIFADEYLIDLNATRAYRVAYPSVKRDETAAAAAARMLRNVKVQEYISERMQERQQRTEVTQDMVVKELAAIAFARATDYAVVKGGTVCIKDTDSLSDEQIRAIAGIKDGKFGVEVRLNDKEKALELLGRHLGMWNDKLDGDATIITPTNVVIAKLRYSQGEEHVPVTHAARPTPIPQVRSVRSCNLQAGRCRTGSHIPILTASR